MSQDLTKTLPPTDSEKLTLILTTVQSLTVRVDGVDSRMHRVEQTLDDSRPVLQKLVTDVGHLQIDITHLKEGQRRLEEGQESLRSDLKAFRRNFDHRFLILSGSVLSRYTELEQRVTHLELSSTPPNTET